jgi:predicted nucleic acid binding AN1-type Zn finger protein
MNFVYVVNVRCLDAVSYSDCNCSPQQQNVKSVRLSLRQNNFLRLNSRRENPKLLQNFKPKNNAEKLFFHYHFNLVPAIAIQSWHSKSIFLNHKMMCTSSENISKTYLKNVSDLCE